MPEGKTRGLKMQEGRLVEYQEQFLSRKSSSSVEPITKGSGGFSLTADL